MTASPGGSVRTAHFCPRCGEQCGCTTAEVSAGPEEEEVVEGCVHPCRGGILPARPTDVA